LPVLASDHQRVQLLPQFKPGDSLRYQIESQMTIAGTTTTPIVNPEGATEVKQSVSIVLRLDVLEVAPAALNATRANPTTGANAAHTTHGAPGTNAVPVSMRIRATYEKSSAISESDAYDPTSASLADQYNRLEGRSMEFTLEPDGRIVDIKGLEDMLQNPSAAQTVRSWMAGLSSSAGFPSQGIEIGQKWSREQPLTGVPLDRLFWRTEATYLRNEICPGNTLAGGSETSAAPAPEAAPKTPNANSPTCATILTQFTIARRGSHNPRADDTPDDYRHNGLRTSGTWTGSGESLDSFSLATGRMLRSTQSSSQDLDFAITSTSTGSRMTYKGKIETRTEIILLP
ncbi:MAG: hypothetical protein WB723_10985, partial [Candidatus Acidiferrales bacterium]